MRSVAPTAGNGILETIDFDLLSGDAAAVRVQSTLPITGMTRHAFTWASDGNRLSFYLLGHSPARKS